jgi:hypothetical protein
MVEKLAAAIENLKSTVIETSTQLEAQYGEKESALTRARESASRRHHGGSLVGPIVARIAKVAFK